ncbi:MAG: MBOAT family protein [Oscillospiraceae bacterium]|jgi:alginate O-acetyltransferase complex protein AlgI|nr:MBOAT family protein [Oscillospiraceae bacterium]
MLFTSNLFVFLFLPLTLGLYYLAARRFRNAILLALSLLFYAWGEPKFIAAMVASIIFNYLMALVVDWRHNNGMSARWFMYLAVAANLAFLFVYKYLNFTVDILNHNPAGFHIAEPKITLPIGISFFTFQAMSYVIDVYRQDVPAQKKPWNVALYVAFFPQLIAGPIVRYTTIEDQINNRKETFTDFSEGVKRFIIGFAKKIILANNMALIAEKAFAMADPQRSVAYAWIGAIAYSFQILFDFSGYSDMAIGLGRMFGFHFLENFNYPYISKSISEFWRRWHMSLGEWFRDYLYFPLGGSRVETKLLLARNLFVVWALTGVWHGASWNFLVWGLMYFGLIVGEKLLNIPKRFKKKYQSALYQAFTLLAVVFGWVLFRAADLPKAVGYMGSMLGLSGNALTDANVVYALREYKWFLIFAALCSTELFKTLPIWLRKLDERAKVSAWKPIYIYIYRVVISIFSILIPLGLFAWSVSFLILGAHNPFIYFNF